MGTEWRLTTKYIVGLGLALLGFYVIYLARPVIPLLIIGALIAFLVRPVISFLYVRLKVPWPISVLITYLLATVIILLAPLIFIPPIVDAVNFLLGLDYQILIDNALRWLENTLLSLRTFGLQILGFDIALDSIVDPMLTAIQSTGPVLTPKLPSLQVIINSLGSIFATSYGVAVNVVGTVFAAVVSFVFMILSAVYFNLHAHRLYGWFLDTVPQAYRSEMVILLGRLRLVWEHFFKGQVLLMVMVGSLVWLGGTVIGLPGAFALGIIAGLLEIIPNLGPTLAAIPAVIVALLQGSTYLPVNNFIFALIVMALYILVNALENNFIVPKVLGEAVDLHPLIVFTGVIVGAATWGILGALLAAPVIASVKEIISYAYRKILSEDPFPPQLTSEGTKASWPDPRQLLARLRQRLAGSSVSSTEPEVLPPGSSEKRES
ncbi:MAG: AI-2E family transporter [Anaerolineae bacterium]|nr:AI-2E family transporter [Anaerolineae bacterium]